MSPFVQVKKTNNSLNTQQIKAKHLPENDKQLYRLGGKWSSSEFEDEEKTKFNEAISA